MKKVGGILWFFVVVGSLANAQQRNQIPSDKLKPLSVRQVASFPMIIREVDRLNSVAYRVGFMLKPGEFHRLSDECLRLGRSEDFRELLKNENPIVRVMGLICLARSVKAEEFSSLAKPMYVDFAMVKLTNGCILNQSVSVGNIAERLVDNRFFLTPEEVLIR